MRSSSAAFVFVDRLVGGFDGGAAFIGLYTHLFRQHRSHPSKTREGWGTRVFLFGYPICCTIRYPRPRSAIYSTQAAMPAMHSWFSVPHSQQFGIALVLGRTL